MRQPKIKAIIFDCDGTLVDSEHSYFLALTKSFQLRGATLDSHEYSSYVGSPKGMDPNFIIQKIGYDCTEELLQETLARYIELQAAGLPPIKPTVDFLHALVGEREKHGFKLGLASASPKNDILINLKNLNIDHYFDIILSGYEDLVEYQDPKGVNKPQPYIYWHAAKMLGFDPWECVAIEDSYAGVTASASAGCFTIAVPNTHTEQHDFSRAHLKIDSFDGYSVESLLEAVTARLSSLHRP